MSQQILGLDYGERKLGVAIADLTTHVVTPLCVLEGTIEQFYTEVAELVRQQHIQQVVVGMPLRQDGTASARTVKVQKFIGNLRERLGVPVVSQDERFSTRAAQAQLREAGKRQSKYHDDDLAAAQILQSYLDRLATSTFV